MTCRRLLVWVIFMSTLASLSCKRSFVKKETFLLPDGYVGPVVVVFGEPRGQGIRVEADGMIVYEVPASGVLWLKDERPVGSWVKDRYFYVGQGGGRREIPKDASVDTLQVFQYVIGGSGRENGKEMIPTGSIQFVVGVPSARGDWVHRRDDLVGRAIQMRAIGP